MYKNSIAEKNLSSQQKQTQLEREDDEQNDAVERRSAIEVLPLKSLNSDEIYRDIEKNIPELIQNFGDWKKISHGTYSQVFVASLRDSAKKEPVFYALKYLLPIVKPERIMREIEILRDFNGQSNIIPLHSVYQGNGRFVIVMPVVKYQLFSDVYQVAPLKVIREYIKRLLISLVAIHEKGIVHCDIKPSNFLYNFRTGNGSLVDFGLSETEENVQNSIRESYQKAFEFLQEKIQNLKNSQNKTFGESANKKIIDGSQNIQKACKRKMDDSFVLPNSSKINQPLSKLKVAESPTELISNSAHETQIKNRDPLKVCNSQISSKSGGLQSKQSPKESVSRISNYHPDFFGSPNFETVKKHKEVAENNKNSKLDELFYPKVRGLCKCLSKAEMCSPCFNYLLARMVPCGGTRGFKAPEVLFRASTQNCKQDIWSAGVIFASFLSARYPFFHRVDDFESLEEMAKIFGSKRMSDLAMKMERTILLDREYDAMELRSTIKRLRQCIFAENPRKIRPMRDVPDQAYDLLDGLLDPDPETRLTAKQALENPFFDDNLKL